jgi:cytidyltransferase-like protein
MSLQPAVVVSGGFDDLRARHLRWFEEAARMGELTVLLWTDEALRDLTGQPPKFPMTERLYLLQAVRYIRRVIPVAAPLDADTLPQLKGFRPQVWVDEEDPANGARCAYGERHGLDYRVVPTSQMQIFPVPPPVPVPSAPGRKKVVVTGCYDWFHSGHVRFFQEVSAFGDLYVVVGHDANIRLLKGAGHPLLSQEKRRYLVGSIKYVTQALISSGEGWLDADPEIRQLKPDIYAVNVDGDKGGKREYCAKMGLEYLVLQRTPAPGLPRRTGTSLRGF